MRPTTSFQHRIVEISLFDLATDVEVSKHRRPPKTIQDFVQRYPRVLTKLAHAGQLTNVDQAAVILRDAVERRKNYSDWVLTEYKGDALQAVRRTLKRLQTDRT